MSDDLLTIEEAARVARCSGNAIRRAVAAGRIKTVAVERGPLMVLDMIHRRDAERFTLTYPANEAKRRARFKGRGKG